MNEVTEVLEFLVLCEVFDSFDLFEQADGSKQPCFEPRGMGSSWTLRGAVTFEMFLRVALSFEWSSRVHVTQAIFIVWAIGPCSDQPRISSVDHGGRRSGL